MINSDKVAIGAVMLGIYSILLIFAFMACQNNMFPFTMILPLITGMLGMLLIIFCGLEI